MTTVLTNSLNHDCSVCGTYTIIYSTNAMMALIMKGKKKDAYSVRMVCTKCDRVFCTACASTSSKFCPTCRTRIVKAVDEEEKALAYVNNAYANGDIVSLINELNSDSIIWRMTAKQILVIAGPSAVSHLCDLLCNRDPRIKRTAKDSAKWALIGIGEPAIPILLQTLRDRRQHEIWSTLAFIIGKTGRDDGTEELNNALNDNSPALRSSANIALNSMKSGLSEWETTRNLDRIRERTERIASRLCVTCGVKLGFWEWIIGAELCGEHRTGKMGSRQPEHTGPSNPPQRFSGPRTPSSPQSRPIEPNKNTASPVDPQAITSLIKALGDPAIDFNDPKECMQLVEIGPDAVPLLLANLTASAYIPMIVATIGDQRGLEPLMTLARSGGAFATDNDRNSWRGTEVAVRALGKLGDARALPLLDDIYQRTNIGEVSIAAKQAIDRIKSGG